MPDKKHGLGKIDPAFFAKVIYPRLGAKNSSVIVGPASGVDFGAIDLGSDVLVMSTDPFFIQPSLGWERAAWFAVHILASDVAVSGIPPRFMAVDLNLPPQVSDSDIRKIWSAVDRECKNMGISVITGHTARYAGCSFPMVGGGTVFGIGPKEKLIIPRARAGDSIIVTKGAAIEATGLMAVQFPEFLEERFGKAFVRKAKDVFYQMSTVEDALTAASVEGVTAMHDATECGVLGGLFEIAGHSGVGMRIHKDKIPVQDVVRKTCGFFGLDPYISISEGTLLATAAPESAEKIVAALGRKGIGAGIVGEVTGRGEGIMLLENGNESRIGHPGVDPFWARFEEFLGKQGKKQI